MTGIIAMRPADSVEQMHAHPPNLCSGVLIGCGHPDENPGVLGGLRPEVFFAQQPPLHGCFAALLSDTSLVEAYHGSPLEDQVKSRNTPRAPHTHAGALSKGWHGRMKLPGDMQVTSTSSTLRQPF